jgi:uncharacterized cupin superfamily protein
MVPEAPFESAEHGAKVPSGEGWFVLNAADALWLDDGSFGQFTRFEGPAARFGEIGINIGVLLPGQAACMYHREDNQENFLVLSGECLLLVEGEERRLKAWDFVHCPPMTDHVIVGAGDGPSAILALGARAGRDTVYSVSELAAKYGGSVTRETSDPDEAYAGTAEPMPVAFDPAWLANRSASG